MAISLNTDTQTNTLAANSNLATASGGAAPPNTTSTSASAGFGPAVIISLSPNAELSLSQVADEYPDSPGETVVVNPPPTEPVTPDEVVVVRANRPYFTPNFIFSNNGWNDTTSWAQTNGENMPDAVTPTEPPPIQLIQNRPVRPSHTYTDRMGNHHQVINKPDMLRAVRGLKSTLESGVTGGAIGTALFAGGPTAAEAFFASPWGRAVLVGSIALEYGLIQAESYLEAQTDDWELDINFGKPPESDEYQPYRYMPPGMEEF